MIDSNLHRGSTPACLLLVKRQFCLLSMHPDEQLTLLLLVYYPGGKKCSSPKGLLDYARKANREKFKGNIEDW